MPRFIVEKREVWTQMVEVVAKDAEEAKLLVSRGQGRMLDETLEYSHDLATDYWTVDETSEKGSVSRSAPEFERTPFEDDSGAYEDDPG
jgi:hypothetical protein